MRKLAAAVLACTVVLVFVIAVPALGASSDPYTISIDPDASWQLLWA